ncbi:MAG: hypothetical protein D6701_12775, partial [Gemmatimonadetes bacterium]
MIVAHLSDLHLGFQAYGRVDERGRNLREADVAAAFHAAVDAIIEIAPDVVAIAGDVFDHAHPAPRALVDFSHGLARLREALPDCPVVIAAGARDTPHGADAPGVLDAFAPLPGVHVATTEARSLRLLDGDLEVWLLPHRAVLAAGREVVRPGNGAARTLLVAHALADPGRGPKIREREWSYVALGGRHRRTRWRERVHDAGSLERVGPAPWEEAAEEKGFLVADLEQGTVEFRPLPGRPVVALAPIDFDPQRPDRLRERVVEVLEELPGGIDDKIVRLRVRGLGADEFPRIQGILAGYRARALHLEVEVT